MLLKIIRLSSILYCALGPTWKNRPKAQNQRACTYSAAWAKTRTLAPHYSHLGQNSSSRPPGCRTGPAWRGAPTLLGLNRIAGPFRPFLSLDSISTAPFDPTVGRGSRAVYKPASSSLNPNPLSFLSRTQASGRRRRSGRRAVRSGCARHGRAVVARPRARSFFSPPPSRPQRAQRQSTERRPPVAAGGRRRCRRGPLRWRARSP